MIRKPFLFSAFALAVLSVSGCINLISPAKNLPPRYTLSAADIAPVEPKIPATIAIADARVEGALNTAKIAVRTAPNELRYLADGDWSDRVPRLFSRLLERSLEARQQFLAVSDRVALPISDYTLYADIAALNIDRTGRISQAEVVFRMRLEASRGTVLGAEEFSDRVEAKGNTTRDAAAAINIAAGQTTKEAAAWAAELIEQHRMTTSLAEAR